MYTNPRQYVISWRLGVRVKWVFKVTKKRKKFYDRAGSIHVNADSPIFFQAFRPNQDCKFTQLRILF